MLKASVLYMVIIIALIMALLCSALIMKGYFYGFGQQKINRSTILTNNLASGINILLAAPDSGNRQKIALSLFNLGNDSVTLEKLNWGIYSIGIVKAFIETDTVFSVFSMANTLDSAKWAVLYLADQDRPLSVSGETSVKGNVFLPKAGVKKTYVNGKAYRGDDKLVDGLTDTSHKILPSLNPFVLQTLLANFVLRDSLLSTEKSGIKRDTIENSFTKPTLKIRLGRNTGDLKHVVLRGNIIVLSDSCLVIEPSAILDKVVVFARSIFVEKGFRGNCQLFATDSIHVGPDCLFDYPSCLGVLNKNTSVKSPYLKITIDKNTQFKGAIFTYRPAQEEIMPILKLDSNVTVSGQIYSRGILQYSGGLNVRGSIFTRLFTYQNGSNLMENVLINANLSSKSLSSYYLSSPLFPVVKRKKILEWLERN